MEPWPGEFHCRASPYLSTPCLIVGERTGAAVQVPVMQIAYKHLHALEWTAKHADPLTPLSTAERPRTQVSPETDRLVGWHSNKSMEGVDESPFAPRQLFYVKLQHVGAMRPLCRFSLRLRRAYPRWLCMFHTAYDIMKQFLFIHDNNISSHRPCVTGI